MAVLDLFECQVLIDDTALNEYDDDDDEGEHPVDQKIIKKYIEAESGANFAIRLRIKPGLSFVTVDCLCADIFLDGEWKDGSIVSEKSYKKSKSKAYTITHAGMRCSDSTGWVLRKFRFGEIKTGAEILFCYVRGLGQSITRNLQLGEIPAFGSGDNLDLKYNKLGLIEVEFWRYKILSKEKILKDSNTKPWSLDEPEPIQVCDVFKGNRIGDKPFAVFELKYRSKESLKQLLIVPRTPSPTPLEERPLEDLSIEEAREVIRRQKAEVEATKARIKKERADSNLHTLRAVKRLREDMGIDGGNEVEAIAERSAHKKHRPASQEVIELFD